MKTKNTKLSLSDIDITKIDYNKDICYEKFRKIVLTGKLFCCYDNCKTVFCHNRTNFNEEEKKHINNNVLLLSNDDFTQLLLILFDEFIKKFCLNTRKNCKTVKNFNFKKFKILCPIILAGVFICLFIPYINNILSYIIVIYYSICIFVKNIIFLLKLCVPECDIYKNYNNTTEDINTINNINYCDTNASFQDRNVINNNYYNTYHSSTNNFALPKYTILIPMFKEHKETIQQSINAMKNLVYPKELLDVKLVLESDDNLTREVLDNIVLPNWMTKVWVPYFEPRTKPKACNVASLFAVGDILTIFDAEDIPDEMQLLMAVEKFNESNYYNNNFNNKKTNNNDDNLNKYDSSNNCRNNGNIAIINNNNYNNNNFFKKNSDDNNNSNKYDYNYNNHINGNITINNINDNNNNLSIKSSNNNDNKCDSDNIVTSDIDDNDNNNNGSNNNDKVDILQCNLCFYNYKKNFLTEYFNIEYNIWFKFMLSELSKHDITIPLGGTSNHIKFSCLEKNNFWDSYNVTEDLELSTIIAEHNNFDKQQHHHRDNSNNNNIVNNNTNNTSNSNVKIHHMNSETKEWCVTNIKSWLKQRTRWLKGYLMIYFLYFFSKKLNSNLKNIVYLHVIIGNATLSFLCVHFLFIGLIQIKTSMITSIFYIICLLYNICYALLYYKLIVKEKTYKKTKQTIFVCITYPLYFFLHTIAAWTAIFDIFNKPFYWSKTNHMINNDKSKNTN